MTAPSPIRVLIAASGTGGHLIPALSIAQQILQRNSESCVEFVGSGRPLEEKIIDQAGFKRHVIPTVGIARRGIAGKIEFISSAPKAYRICKEILQNVRPQVILGVGGYVTFFPVLLGWRAGIKTWIHEADIKPGIANRVLSRVADKISVVYGEAGIRLRQDALVTGYPVRPEIRAQRRDDLPIATPRKLLVLGGSQGAHAVDQAVLHMAPFLKEREVEIIHQCRPENKERLEGKYRELGITALVMPFIEDPAFAYGWSDLIISRAGAGAVSEIAAVGRPAIFVPLPSKSGTTEQGENAKLLVEAGKALLITEGEGFFARIQSATQKLLLPNNYKAFSTAASPVGLSDAADTIADGLYALVSQARG